MISLKSDSRFLLTVWASQGYYDCWEPIDFSHANDSAYQFSTLDLVRQDSIANSHYTDPALWWIMCHHSTVEDPFTDPDFSDVSDPDDCIRYPSYIKEGNGAPIDYPTKFLNPPSTVNLDDLSKEDWEKIIKDIISPQIDQNSVMVLPSTNLVHKGMSDASNRSTALS